MIPFSSISIETSCLSSKSSPINAYSLKMLFNGIEFLRIVKSDDVLKTIPVVALTVSLRQQDKIEGFELGVAGYIVKPPDYESFVKAIGTINMYWNFSELPNLK